jgi:hypothetical protein
LAGGATTLPRPMLGRLFVYQPRDIVTSPMTPCLSFSMASISLGYERRWVPCWMMVLYFRWAARRSSPSCGLWQQGFST